MDIPRVDAWSLHCLSVLVKECNVTRAGAALGLSQPATSAILAKLRVLFQDPLLVKSATGMVATPRALELAVRSAKLLDEMRGMVVSGAVDPSGLQGKIAIAAMDLVRVLVLPKLLAALQFEAPGLSITVHDADRTRIHERFEQAEVDLAIGPQVVSSGRLHYRELWCDSAAALVREGHPSLNTALTPQAFAQLTHVRVIPSRPSFYDDALEKALLAQGLKRHVQASERSFLMVPRLLEATDLLAVVPRRFAIDACERHPLRTFEVPLELIPLSMGLYWHERTHRHPMFQWLRQRIVELAGVPATA
ncbi:LysR family transcriptional regulator [Ottowia caeni]|uniref:LysR family transcriptional regulator n=1 Tax=Ottowia caeni TaxID=2870339 RepID=UPI001E297CBB|nr:LysR family transcriptional regulator [Ottowia caeni]